MSLRAAQQAQGRRHREAEALFEKASAARKEVTELSDQVLQGLGASHLLLNFGPESCLTTWRGLQGSCYLRTACGLSWSCLGSTWEGIGEDSITFRVRSKGFEVVEWATLSPMSPAFFARMARHVGLKG